MKLGYFDCFSGASGDMILGALVDTGLPVERLQDDLSRLGLSNFSVEAHRVTKGGISGTKVTVSAPEDRHRGLSDIETIIESSQLEAAVRQKSIRIFRRLAEAEARVHGKSVEEIHFHEVGALDAIVDVVGSVIGLTALGLDVLHCSPLHVGCGTVRCAHGTLPVPAPATAELLKGKPIYATGVEGELVTPTGAAILTTLCSAFGPMPQMTLEAVGYGAGSADRDLPNLLRLSLGQTAEDLAGYGMETVAVGETNIDDMNPQIYDYVITCLLDMGALDAFLTHVHMKKNRPGTVLTVICRPGEMALFSDFLMRQTTTIGVRWRQDARIKAARSVEEIETIYGLIRVKVARRADMVLNVTPEYEDCKRVARERHIPLKKVMDQVKSEALRVENWRKEP